MQIVKTQKILYNKQQRIRLISEGENDEFKRLVTKLPGIQWSNALNSWHTPEIQNHLQYFNSVFPTGIYFYDISTGVNMPVFTEHIDEKEVIIRQNYDDNTLILYFPEDEVIPLCLQNLGDSIFRGNKNSLTIKNSPENSLSLNLFLKKANYATGYMTAEKNPGHGSQLNTLIAREEIEFRIFLKDNGYVKRTADQYVFNVQRFLKSSGTWQEDKLAGIADYIEEIIIGGNYSISYQNQVINSLKAYHRFKSGNTNPTINLKRPRRKHHSPDILTRQEISRIIRLIPNLKHQVLVSTIYITGMKVSEAVCIRPSDIDMDNMEFNIRDRKGDFSRTVPLTRELAQKLQAYRDCYQQENFLFEGYNGRQYSERSIQKVVKKYVQKAGISKKTSVQTLRHSCAGHMAAVGVDFKILQEFLGYTNFRSTQIYRQHVQI